jgi:hypothetical protein
VFGFATALIEERETEVVTVLLQHPRGVLRWVEHLTTFDVEHSRVHSAHPGWAVTVTGPDLVRIQLQTDAGPSGEDE